MTLNRRTSIPLYVQIKEQLAGAIRSGKWQPGDRVPSGPELSDEYGVSVMTVRQAIGELVNEGVLVSERGRGTYVARQKLSTRLPYFIGFTTEMKLRGYEPKTLIIGKGVTDANADIAARLAIPDGSRVVWYDRLRLADGEPICYETSYFSYGRFPDFPFPEGEYVSSYYIFEKEYGVQVVRAEQAFHAVKATAKQSKILQIPPESPVLLLVSTEFDGEDSPVQFTLGAYRGDRYNIMVERMRRD
ncbi:MAG: GntR family transcriptional regulator [Clostridia bacterium]|nr:GntR family transcriptional regulator [Clostridia bacterium]